MIAKTAEGWKLADIRRYTEERWGDVGPSTDTPWPPEDLYATPIAAI